MGFTHNKQFLLQIAGLMMIPVILLSVRYYLTAGGTESIPQAEEAIKDFEEHIAKEIVRLPVDLNEINIAEGNLFEISGTASYYAKRFHNRTTANGEKFDMNEFSAAHRNLPFGTILRVTNLKNNKSTLVRINDRGPYAGKRILDLSRRSAKAIGGLGLPKVKLEGFIPGKTVITGDDTYFYGYSLNSPPICVQDRYVELLDSTNVFHDVVTQLKERSEDEDDLFVMLVANEKNRKESPDNDFLYYIGKIKNEIEITRKEFLANK